ncbi:MAG: carboxypeptidase-like regulatory domain-containing protein [Marinilabiliales bacterium]|nr:carboxypeptidase-like regulatory domain-containing protein [Marinilabiliales bacterium]
MLLLRERAGGVATDMNGSYTITDCPPDAKVLTFSYVGYDQTEVPVNGRSVVNASHYTHKQPP